MKLAFLFAVTVGFAGAASAQTINITTGFVDVSGSSGPVYLVGDRGFTYSSGFTFGNNLLGPGDCNSDPGHCVSGSTVSYTINIGNGAIPSQPTCTGQLGGSVTSSFGTTTSTLTSNCFMYPL